MFKNFDKVFKFTFKNQASTKSYKCGTIITAIILFVLPVAIFLIVGKILQVKGNEVKECGADRIYVVDTESPNANFNALNMAGIEGYTDIQYFNAESVEEALEKIEDRNEETSLVLQIEKVEGKLYSRIILPDSSIIDKKKAGYYKDFIDKASYPFCILASGISVEDMSAVMRQTDYSVYDTKGYKEGVNLYEDQGKVDEQKNAEILPTFNTILTYAAIILIYLIIIVYGNGILQSIVLEKSSKLMDTMLISVAPEAMIFGKMLAVLLTGILQVLIWIAALVGGVISGVKLYSRFFSDVEGPIMTFLKSFKQLGLFKLPNVIVGILALIFGIVLYASISAVAGAVSGSREEAASNQSIFIIILIVSFYLVLFKGINTTDVTTWLYLCPFTAAMVLPSGICVGVVSVGTAIAGLAILVICSLLLLILAGKIYKMMSLYKGNAVNIGKALKMLVSK